MSGGGVCGVCGGGPSRGTGRTGFGFFLFLFFSPSVFLLSFLFYSFLLPLPFSFFPVYTPGRNSSSTSPASRPSCPGQGYADLVRIAPRTNRQTQSARAKDEQRNSTIGVLLCVRTNTDRNVRGKERKKKKERNKKKERD